MIAVLIGYAFVAAYLIRHLPPNDMERSMLDLDHAEMAGRYAREFGGDIPRQMPFRLPLEYLLWSWTRNLVLARCVGVVVGAQGLLITMDYAQHLGGNRAALVAGLVVVSSPALVGVLASASYVPYMATLWIGGLYGLSQGYPIVAIIAATALTVLRPTSWWQAGALLVLAWHPLSLVAACVLSVYLITQEQRVVASQGWTRVLRREPCPVQGIPQDGWWYGLKILLKRYETWTVWGTVALVFGSWHAEATWLLGLTGILFVATHFPRMLIRPKWAVGYVAEWALPVAVALGVMLR